ncbi:translation initiation factor [Pseudoflavitalea sp. G-6-1-2]|uniref:translation initiation factor n=1 Tax=Pseudoflavitalea sp. G-6-1-2 TaxID=2728841 RepID=UPI00146B8734|nr:translation initiation factor [Pseudoflavitalea sp. G-6-1-2]NML19486.1 translation initiation factor [Pseudoflavitalea sp. G-6-1-2]
MSKKNKGDNRGFVYSTDPNFKYEEESNEAAATLPPAQQQLRVQLDGKQRAGKVVTIVFGFTGTSDDLEALGKQLKNYCGTGGSVKDGEIIIQGDQREKVMQFLIKQGYSKSKKSGG